MPFVADRSCSSYRKSAGNQASGVMFLAFTFKLV